MNDSTNPELDDLERDVIRALRAKADQVAVEDGPFRAGGQPAPAIPLRPERPQRRRRVAVLAAAAAAAVLVGGVATVQRLGTAGDSGDTGGEVLPVASSGYVTWPDGVAGLLPATLPEGWALRDLSAGAVVTLPAEVTWQLFSEDGATPRGALVGSATNAEDRLVEGPTHTVQGQPARVGPAAEPQAPAGAVHATWLDGDVVHDAIAVGMTEDELVTFLDSLAPLQDRTQGFAPPDGADLREAGASTVGALYTAGATYAGPGGDGDTIRVTAQSPDHYGGLLQNLAGEPAPGGHVLAGALGGDAEYPFAAIARDDGWTVEVLSEASPTVAQRPGLLPELLDATQPVTAQQVVDIGLAEPITVTGRAGAWAVEVHGTDAAPVALCLTPDGAAEPACTTAEDWPGTGLTTGSATVGGEWLLAVVSEGAEPTVRPAPNGATEGPDDRTQEELHGERNEADGRVVEVFTIPDGVDTVGVMIPTVGEESMGQTYQRPPG